MTYKEVDKILQKNGWKNTRTTGSHYQYKKPGVNYTATVPRHVKKDISIGVLKDLERGTGLSFT